MANKDLRMVETELLAGPGPVHADRLFKSIRGLGATTPKVPLEIHCLPGQGVSRSLSALAHKGLAQMVSPEVAGDQRLTSLPPWRILTEAGDPSLPSPERSTLVTLVQPPRFWSRDANESDHLRENRLAVEDCRLTHDEVERLATAIGAPCGCDVPEDLVTSTAGWLVPLELALWSWTEGLWSPIQPLEDCPGMAEFSTYRLAPVLGLLSEAERKVVSASLPATAAEGLSRHLKNVRNSRGRAGLAATAAASPAWDLRLLGKPELAQRRPDGSLVPVSLSFRRLLEFLGLLACSPRFEATKEVVLDRLWKPDDRQRALKNLHPMASHLRKVLGGGASLTLEHGVYRIDPATAMSVDLAGFREGCAPGASLGAREAAWTLYQGEFMEGHDDSWILEQREEFREMYMKLLDGLGQEYQATDRPQDAEDAYRTLLSQDPLQEHIYLEIMRLYRDGGRRDLVRRLYERMCRVLQSELGISPLETTVQAYDELMS